MSEETFIEAAERMGHKLIRRDEDEGGEVDMFVVGEGFHNGPGCEVCHDSWCVHCVGDNFVKIKPCDGGASHAAYIARRDRAEWLRLIEAYGPDGPGEPA